MNSTASNNGLINKFDEFMQSNNMRKTPERFAILEYIAKTRGHFTIEMVLQHIETSGFHVSRATVYNTINLLVNAGMLHCHNIEGIAMQYELATVAPHFHLVCTSCGKIKEVHDNNFIAFMNTRKYNAFTPQRYSLYAYGTCSTCARKKKRINRKTNKIQ